MDNAEMVEAMTRMQAQIDAQSAAIAEQATHTQGQAEITKENVGQLRGKALLDNIDSAWQIASDSEEG